MENPESPVKAEEPETPKVIEPKQGLTVMVSPVHFDINLVCDSFLRSIDDKSAIDVFLYLQAFSELNKQVAVTDICCLHL